VKIVNVFLLIVCILEVIVRRRSKKLIQIQKTENRSYNAILNVF
jgi:hypothetical protein